MAEGKVAVVLSTGAKRDPAGMWPRSWHSHHRISARGRQAIAAQENMSGHAWPRDADNRGSSGSRRMEAAG